MIINKTKTISITSYENRVRIFWVLVAVLVLSVFAYIYAINATARYTATRQNLEREIAGISSKLNVLEFSYIDLRNDVTMELAHLYGFKEKKNPLYLSRASVSLLSFNSARK